MGRQAYRNCRHPSEEGDDRQQERGVAPRHEQENNEERTNCERNNRDRSPAASPRTASAMVGGARPRSQRSTGTRSRAPSRARWQDSRHSASAHQPETRPRAAPPPTERAARPRDRSPARAAADRAPRRRDHDQQAGDDKGRDLRPAVWSARQRTRPRDRLAAHEFPAKPMEIVNAGPAIQPHRITKNGPATRPAIAPARRNALPFRAALAVLPATAQSYGDAQVIVNGDHHRCGCASRTSSLRRCPAWPCWRIRFD
jgi:hypothetical protein